MSKIPEFRVWYDNKMWCLAKLDLWGDPDQAICDLAPYLPKYEELYDIYLSDVILMQYTGLKDKNGVEIFEGDWIRVETQEKDNGEFPIGYVVTANDKPEMFIALPEQHKETGERQYHLENLYKHYSDEFEVIGDIYENSDLI